MNYSKKYIHELSIKEHFINSNLEKVIRLIEIINYIFNSSLKHKLVLKGGTAINLIYTNLARLSTDIDLDYIGDFELDNINSERIKIEENIDNYMMQNGYGVSNKSRKSKNFNIK